MQFAASLRKAPNINAGVVNNMVFPVTTWAEQKRIVAKVDELMGLCDTLEAAQQTRNTLRQSLRASALDALMTAPSDGALSTAWAFVRDNWDTMSDRPEDVEGLRQGIVHLAVKGKLGTQDINDDSAQTTFDSWKEYRDGLFKVQKDHGSEYSRMINKLSSIKEVEGFFVAPKKWIFAHLIELSILIVDCHNKTAPAVLEGIPLIRTSNIRDRKLNFKGMKYVPSGLSASNLRVTNTLFPTGRRCQRQAQGDRSLSAFGLSLS
jgi:type I restriction enzyme S subunit